MQTLSLHNHFDLGPDVRYQREPQLQKDDPHNNTENMPNYVNKHLKGPMMLPKVKSESALDLMDSNKENKQPNGLSLFATAKRRLSDSADDHNREREYFMRCVVIGDKDTGKHTLINASFPETTSLKQRREADLIMKEKIQLKTTKKYHFWVRTLNEPCETKEAIWKTYYKWASAFVFVYDITNKESFQALEKAVKDVLRVIPKEKFFGVLVGNKDDLGKEAKVDYEVAEEFSRKYNFSDFVATNVSKERETSQLLEKIDSKLKLTFESI